MTTDLATHAETVLAGLRAEGLYKQERLLAGPQGGRIRVCAGPHALEMINLCSNNYLGLAGHPDVARAAHAAIDEFGFGMASVRFICGSQTLHRELEGAIARYLRKDDAILFAACFDANAGLFEGLLGPEDAIISDSLNHASIIDGVRLSKAKRHRFPNGDMGALEEALKKAGSDGARFKLIVTDGVFSMDGAIARLPEIAALAHHHGASVMVDDSHATGHLGEGGRGTPTLTGTEASIEIVSGTLGKTLGGGMGGFIAAAQPIVDLLRQRARPYLFSNSLSPAMAGGSLKAIELAERADEARATLGRHATRFRTGLAEAGFDLAPGETPIIPVMTGDAVQAQRLSSNLATRGVYVTAFSYPVVPRGQARIRTQMSAALTEDDIGRAIEAFVQEGRSIGLI